MVLIYHKYFKSVEHSFLPFMYLYDAITLRQQLKADLS